MIEFLLSLILLVMLFVIYKLRKLPWYISEYEGIQMKIWNELMDINHHYKNKAMNYSRIYEKRENDRQKIFEINNKLSEIIKLSEQHIEVHINTAPENRLREILELLISINYKRRIQARSATRFKD